MADDSVVSNNHIKNSNPNLAKTNVSEKFDCELCLESFNIYDRKPVCLVPCGHSLCIKCYDNLRKNVCPFCRMAYENKIINWEISKRLPKPTIPIIYYQTQIKLNTLKDLLDEFSLTNKQWNSNLKSKIDKRKENSNQMVFDKLKEFEKTLSENYQENLECESNLKKVNETFKMQIEMDEIKYSEESLRKLKTEIENVHQYFGDKLSTIKNEDTKIKEILMINDQKDTHVNNSNSNSVESSFDAETLVKKLQTEIDERKKKLTLSRQLAVLLSHTNATVRPAGLNNTNTANLTTDTLNLNENNNASTNANTDSTELTGFSYSQKIFIISVVGVLTVVLMIYPIAMIAMGAVYRDQCQMNNLIPVWLLVSGACTCLIDILTGVFLSYTVLRFFVRKTFKERLVVILTLLLPLTFLFVFNLAWFFAGNAWVYSIYRSVQFDDKTLANFCNQQVYLFAFWTLNASYIIIGSIIFAANLICCCFCCLKKQD